MPQEATALQEAAALHREAVEAITAAAEAPVAEAVLAAEAVVDNANRHFDRPKGVEKSTAKKRLSICIE